MQCYSVNRFLILCLFTSNYIVSAEYYRTLLFGESFKGFLKISKAGDNEYIVSFDIRQSIANATWSLHMSSAPYDMAVMTDNCKRVKKSPHLRRNMKLTETTLRENDLIGNTIVIGTLYEVFACATIILPDQPLLSGTFHTKTFDGHIHVIPLENQIRLLTDLRFLAGLEDVQPDKDIINWNFVQSCQNSSVIRESDGSELGIDSRTTISLYTLTNFTLSALAIYVNGSYFACSELSTVEPRVLMAVNLVLAQKNYYEPVYADSDPAPGKLRIRDDCLDISTESIHDKYDRFYPSVNIFGPDSIMLKSQQEDICSVLRPQFPRPAATAYFLHPIKGRVTIVDTEDKVLLTGEVRHVFEQDSSRASVQISRNVTGPAGCQPDFECIDCQSVEDAAVIVGKYERTVSLSGVYPWFNISEMKSIVIDLQWTKVCANLTFLPHGALSAHALFKRVSPVSSHTVASIVALEYPASNYTEVLINKRQPFSDAVAHSRPMDSSITSGPPCGEQNLGPPKQVFWTSRLKQILGSELNDSSAFIWFNMVTGYHSVLGASVLLSDKKEVFCGSFEPLEEKSIAMAEFTTPFEGYVKLTQYRPSNWASGLPTQIYYTLHRQNKNSAMEKDEQLNWEIVSNDNMTCKGAMIYNPFQIEESECNVTNGVLCPIGSAYQRSFPLTTGIRRHMVVQDVPLTGPFNIIGKSIRLTERKTNGSVTCEPIRLVSEATFRWIVYTNRTLSDIQKQFAFRVDVKPFQVEVDYRREFHKTQCSIFTITVIATDEKIAEILNIFDMDEKKFTDQEKILCGPSDQPKKDAQTSPAPALPTASAKKMDFFVLLLMLFLCAHHM